MLCLCSRIFLTQYWFSISFNDFSKNIFWSKASAKNVHTFLLFGNANNTRINDIIICLKTLHLLQMSWLFMITLEFIKKQILIVRSLFLQKNNRSRHNRTVKINEKFSIVCWSEKSLISRWYIFKFSLNLIQSFNILKIWSWYIKLQMKNKNIFFFFKKTKIDDKCVHYFFVRVFQFEKWCFTNKNEYDRFVVHQIHEKFAMENSKLWSTKINFQMINNVSNNCRKIWQTSISSNDDFILTYFKFVNLAFSKKNLILKTQFAFCWNRNFSFDEKKKTLKRQTQKKTF